MTILSSYILREFLKILALTLGALLSLFVVVDFIENVDDFVRNNVPFNETARFFLLRLPQGLFYMTPMALLLASILHFGLLARRQELTALRSSGVNIHRIAIPVLAIALFVSGILFLLNASVIPLSNQRSEDIKRTFIHHKPRELFFQQNSLWFRVDPRTLYNVELADPDLKILRGVDLYRFSGNFQLVERIHAAEAVYRDNQWILRSGTRWRFNGDDPIQVSRFETTPAYLPIQLTDFPKMVLRAGEMKFGDLRNYVKQLRREGYEVRRLTVDLYGKTAFPLAGGILTLIGLS
ncbi:MAG: LptF/LptG family permease, partial [Nitrospirae bacterium]|nr:LptF/LptG family permease [Nitrospirota bacterium]